MLRAFLNKREYGRGARQSHENEARAAVDGARSAKLATQPFNTRRMYVGYQREWTVSPDLGPSLASYSH
jgi:hypothetical protein